MPVPSSIEAARGPSHGVRMRHAFVTVRDGIELHAVVYLPRSGPGRVPVGVELTPYTTDLMHDVGQSLARAGLGYVVADVRGRGDSQGDFHQFIHDARDGVDLIDWIVQQDWSDGRVFLVGGSYTGLNQWLMLGEGHPAIVAATPGAAVAVGIDVPRGGVANLHNAMWESLVWGHTLNGVSGTDRGLWVQEVREARDRGLPPTAVGEAFGVHRTDVWRQFLEAPAFEGFADMLPAEGGLRSSTVPVLSVTGTHDFCMSGTIYHWERYGALADPSTIERSHLVIGPWDHAGTGTGIPAVGDLAFGDAARVDLDGLRNSWLRHILFDEPKPEFLQDRFMYYVSGGEEWRAASDVSSATRGTRALGLRSLDEVNDVFHSGWLVDGDGGGPDYAVTFDPQDRRVLDIESTRREVSGMGDPSFPMDYHSFMGVQFGPDPTNQIFSVTLDGDGLVYHSRPLTAPLTVVGFPALRLVVIPDRHDTDLSVVLHEIRPDGSAVLVSTEVVRMSRCIADGEGVRVGEENVLDLTGFRFTSRTLGAGSRLRLTLSAAWSTFMYPSPDLADVPVELIVRHGPNTQLTLPLGEAS